MVTGSHNPPDYNGFKMVLKGEAIHGASITALYEAIAAGLQPETDFFFDNSPVFRITGDGVRPIATFDTNTPLRSGWAWGQGALKGGVLVADATVGTGRVLLIGPEVLQRAQPHGTFKLLFNALFAASR